jgi:hypothetical protein
MAHEVLPRPLPDIAILRIYGELTHDDMTCDEELGINDGRRFYLLIDTNEMQVGLPDQFMDGAKRSWFMHANLIHMSMAMDSMMLRMVAKMVSKVTRRQDKMSLYTTREAALNHLLALAAKQDAKK